MTKNNLAVLIVGFGAPGRLEDVPTFLKNVTRGRNIPPERLAEVQSHYAICGGSQYNRQVGLIADGLERELVARGRDLPVYVGMRNWSPYLADVFRIMARDGITRCITVMMFPHAGPASSEVYERAIAEARRLAGENAPEVVSIAPWYEAPGFIHAICDRAEEACAGMGAREREQATWIFTAHSIPDKVAEGTPYVEQYETTVQRVVGELGLESAMLAYQSRSGNPDDPWLEPDVCEAILAAAEEGASTVIVVPVGFLSDHVEVLYDLDIEARRVAESEGLRMIRVGTVQDHPSFLAMLADRVEEKLQATPRRASHAVV